MADKPNTYPSIISNAVIGTDPCKTIHPTNKWRTANVQDFLSLRDYIGIGVSPLILFSSDDTALSSVYVERANQPNAAPNIVPPSKHVSFQQPDYFPMNGYPTETSLIGNLVSLSFANETYGDGVL